MSSTDALLVPRKTGDHSTETREPPLPLDFRIPILYKDDEIMIVDKPYGVRVDGDFPVTVEKLVRLGLGVRMDKFRLCNQLDYSTSGVLVLGLSKPGARNCNKLFTERRSQKWYIAVGHGHIKEPYSVGEPISITERIYDIPGDFRMRIDNHLGLESETVALPIRTGLEVFGQPGTVFLVRLMTGRRHQIRLHLRHIGFPILGDATYGDRADNMHRMMLHAWKLVLPYKSGKVVEVKTGLLQELVEILPNDAEKLEEDLVRYLLIV